MEPIKTIQDLEKIKEKAIIDKTNREKSAQTLIIIGMGTPSIAAGARKSMQVVMDYIADHNLPGIEVLQTGNIGLDSLEPLMRVVKGGKTITYGKVTPDIALRIMSEHIERDQPVESHVVIL